MFFYISLGCDCSVSYQLRKLQLQTHGTMPFDWMKITNIDNLISILDNDFQGFVNFSKYELKEQNAVYDFMDDDDKTTIKSLVKLIHQEYNFTLPHESRLQDLSLSYLQVHELNESCKQNNTHILEFEKKYSRRIERFRNIVKDDTIQKIFVRLSNKKEYKKINDGILINALSKYGCKNFQIKFINLDDYKALIPIDKEFNWHRDYIDWNKLVN
jgi:hypothetical protein